MILIRLGLLLWKLSWTIRCTLSIQQSGRKSMVSTQEKMFRLKQLKEKAMTLPQNILPKDTAFSKLKVFVVPPTLGAHALFDNVVDSPEKADAICLCGGADINPRYYGGRPRGSGFSDRRDRLEYGLLMRYGQTKKWIGICRGAQWLGVFFGGAKLHEHINFHGGTNHPIVAPNGVPLGEVNSAHHQAIQLGTFKNTNTIRLLPLAHSPKDNILELGVILRNGHTHALLIQSHPEFGHDQTEALFRTMMEPFLAGKTTLADYTRAYQQSEFLAHKEG